MSLLPRKLGLIAFILFLNAPLFVFAQETITITAYYSAPYGSYEELSANILNVGLPAGTTTGIIRFRGGAANPATTQEGTLYYNTTARIFRYRDNNSWEDLGGSGGAEQYTKWGDTACASGFTSLYTGYMYQGYQAAGLGGDILCSTGIRRGIYTVNTVYTVYQWEDGRPCAVCSSN